MNLKEQAIKALTFLRIIDQHDGLMSITNVQSIIVLVKLAVQPSVGIVEIGGLLIALASHQGKKLINKKQAKVTEDTEKKIAEMKDTISAVALKVGLKR